VRSYAASQKWGKCKVLQSDPACVGLVMLGVPHPGLGVSRNSTSSSLVIFMSQALKIRKPFRPIRFARWRIRRVRLRRLVGAAPLIGKTVRSALHGGILAVIWV
jgi:hypothetical protein